MSALMDRGFILESLGDLAYLPRELIDMIIEQMDLNSAAKFTQVNRQAQLLLWSRNDYRFIRAVIFGHGLPIMREVITRSKPLLTTVNIQDLADLILAPESAVFKCHLWGRILVPSKLIYGYDDKTRTRCQDLFNDAKWVQLDRDALTGELIGKCSSSKFTAQGLFNPLFGSSLYSLIQPFIICLIVRFLFLIYLGR